MGSRSLRVWLPALRTRSGADVFTMRLADGLLRMGHKPIVQWLSHEWEFASWMLRPLRMPTGIDIIHASAGIGHAFARRGVPLLVTEHQYVRHPAFIPWRSRAQAIYQTLVTGPASDRSIQLADGVTTVSHHAASAIFSVTGRRVEVVYNWVDTDLFRPLTTGAKPSDEVIRLIFIGNPSAWKGVDILPELAAMLGEGFEIHCMGGLRKAFPSEFGAHRGIKLLPGRPVSDMPSLYRKYDIALVPTRYEAFGYVALEAMASGLPVAGFNTTGTAEVCVNGETALLVARDDVPALAESIRRLRDPALRSELGAAGRGRAVTMFNESRSIQAYVNIYLSLLGERVDCN